MSARVQYVAHSQQRLLKGTVNRYFDGSHQQDRQRSRTRPLLRNTPAASAQHHLRAWRVCVRAERRYSENLKRSVFAHWGEIVEEVRGFATFDRADSFHGAKGFASSMRFDLTRERAAVLIFSRIFRGTQTRHGLKTDRFCRISRNELIVRGACPTERHLQGIGMALTRGSGRLYWQKVTTAHATKRCSWTMAPTPGTKLYVAIPYSFAPTGLPFCFPIPAVHLFWRASGAQRAGGRPAVFPSGGQQHSTFSAGGRSIFSGVQFFRQPT